jgi:transcriptional regulator with XRE-family HTH domain
MSKTIYQDRYARLVHALKELRKNNNVTQIELAEKLGKPQSYIAKVETLERKLDIVEFVDWCNAMGQSPSELLKAQLEMDVNARK